MSVGWSSEAKALLEGGSAKVKWIAKLDIPRASDGAYGIYQKDVTDFTLRIGNLKYFSSIVEKNWKLSPVILVVENTDAYFTPNYFGGARDQINNVWRFRDSGEADPEECKVILIEGVKLSDGTWEEITRFQGMVQKINLIDSRAGVFCEITAMDDSLDALNKTLDYSDGDEETYDFP